MAFVECQSLHDKESRCLFAIDAQGRGEKPSLKEGTEEREEYRGDAIR
jgi:hypothetical protein